MKQNLFGGMIAALGACLTFLFGAWDVPLIVLLIFIALDYLTGVARAVIEKKLSSRSGYAGLLKKAFILVIIIAAVLLDRLLSTQWVIRSAACYFYIANEGISILENAASIGLPVPKKLVDVLKQLEEDSGETVKPDAEIKENEDDANTD